MVYNNDNVEIKDGIEENNRILTPPEEDECSYEPYEFKNLEEVKQYVERVKEENHDSLFRIIRNIITKYNDHKQNKINLIATDVFFSYFQDRFSTLHYDFFVGRNGSGKSALGVTFGAIAYRAVIMTDPTAPNLFRLLGKVEPAQCTMIIEEVKE